jgi:N-acetylneuraminate synthase
MANNHSGSVSHGLRIVQMVGRLARRYGIHACVKFQYRNLDSFIHPRFRDRQDVAHVPRFLSTRLNPSEFLTLVAATRDEGLATICTPFDEDSVGLLQDHGVEIVKVASCSATDWPLLECIAAAGKPAICSTGGRSLPEIDDLVSFMIHRHVDFALMHCVSLYPTSPEDVQLGFMARMMRRFPYVPVGYSGHEASDNCDVVKGAVVMGAAILERHVGIPGAGATLNAYSMNPDQAARWVESALQAKQMASGGDGAPKRIRQAELDSLNSLARGAYATRDLKEGQPITRADVFFAMPCAPGQTASGEFRETMIASRDYKELESLSERRPPDPGNRIRTIVDDARGLLYEAHVDIGSEFTIELSHHYGMEHARQIGALFVTVVNREYCKRLVVTLPAQRHPAHFHKQKEETLHVLWGDLQLTLERQALQLTRGDQILIPRDAVHAFSSRGGCVFEELSTRHMMGDSYYQDDRVENVDPLLRQTVLDGW